MQAATLAGYRVVPAAPVHLAALPAIERAAAALFPARVIDDKARAAVQSPGALAAAQAAGRLWVGLDAACEPVGFVIVEERDSVGFIAELDVHPAHQRRGVGRALLETVIAWARARQLGALELTTFEELPWNAPFYARLGFVVLQGSARGAVLSRLLDEEAARGLRERCAMRLVLGAQAARR